MLISPNNCTLSHMSERNKVVITIDANMHNADIDTLLDEVSDFLRNETSKSLELNEAVNKEEAEREELFNLIPKVDLSNSETLIKYEKWKEEDGTLVGLKRLLELA